MNRYGKITEYFEYLVSQKNMHVCIKDFCGFVYINKDLDEALRPFLTHTNPFCMYIKRDRKKYYRCLSHIRQMHDKLETAQGGFFGVCHAGLGEFVVPVRCENLLLGTVNVGFLAHSEKRAEYLMRRCCGASELLSHEEALGLYRKCIVPQAAGNKELMAGIELVAEYLGNTYHAFQNAQADEGEIRLRHNSSEDTIISHAIEFIKHNYKASIMVAEIAAFCFCSESYLSRIFKKRTGVNINVYINKIRAETAKDYLTNTFDSIADIAMNVGFSDPNYFSRVFANLIGCPPTEFRRRFKVN